MFKKEDRRNGNQYERRVAPQVECIIKKKVKVIRVNNSGWVREINIVTWAGGPAKLDIRDWSKDHTRASKGLTFTRQDVINLKDAFAKLDPNDVDEFIPEDIDQTTIDTAVVSNEKVTSVQSSDSSNEDNQIKATA